MHIYSFMQVLSVSHGKAQNAPFIFILQWLNQKLSMQFKKFLTVMEATHGNIVMFSWSWLSFFFIVCITGRSKVESASTQHLSGFRMFQPRFSMQPYIINLVNESNNQVDKLLYNAGISHKLSVHPITPTVHSYNNTLKWGVKAFNLL